jgi:hypothetical protein
MASATCAQNDPDMNFISVIASSRDLLQNAVSVARFCVLGWLLKTCTVFIWDDL